MGRKIISFSLRPVIDDDIAKALEENVTLEITQTDIIRAALRYYFSPNHHTTSLTPPQNIPHQRHTNPPQFEPQDISIELLKKEKDDTQLDAAIDDLLNF